MKKISLLFSLCLAAVITFCGTARGQDTLQIQRPLFWHMDLVGGVTNLGSFGSATLRFYHEKSFVAIGYGGFNYEPDDLPSDYHTGAFAAAFGASDNLNSNSLLLLGYGTFINTAHQNARVLIEADAAIGSNRMAVNFRPVPALTQLFFGYVTGNYEYDYEMEFTIGVRLLGKAELCSRTFSVGINMETYITTSTAAVGIGLSLGVGKLRKKNKE
ncbi:MAG: hypothetical protein JJE25_11360 [Bacteroidia bacterium]|nr:hypothetical protein [Bacteroidia bacterium]